MNKPYFSFKPLVVILLLRMIVEIVFRLGLKEMVLTAAMTL